MSENKPDETTAPQAEDITFSVSQLTLLEDCPEAYRRRYRNKEKLSPGLRAHRGSSVHEVLSVAHKRLIVNRSDLMPVEEARDLAATEFDRRIRSDGIVLAEDEVENPKIAIARSKDDAVAMSSYYVGNVVTKADFEPIAAETMVTANPLETDWRIRGRIDLVLRTPEGDIIPDAKTSSKSPAKGMADRSSQLTFYALLWRIYSKKMPTAVALDYLVRTPTRQTTYYQRQLSTRDERDFQALVNRLNVAVEAVRKGVFIPNTTSWRCNARWCEFWATCKYVANKK